MIVKNLTRFLFTARPEFLINPVKYQSTEQDDSSDDNQQPYHRPKIHALKNAEIPAEIPVNKETGINNFKENNSP